MKILTFISCLLIGLSSAKPQLTTVVVTSTSSPSTITPKATATVPTTGPKDQDLGPTGPKDEQFEKPIVEKLHIRSDIQLRYSKTVVESNFKNPSTTRAQEVEFEMVLPEKAFISNFTIETGGETYVSRVERKENATRIYNEAVDSGRTAGLVDAREGSVFAVKTNVAPAEKLTMKLTYEQLLERRLSQYEQVINLNPGQLVKDMEINVHINETLPVIRVNVPELRQKSNELIKDLDANPTATISGENSTVVNIKYKPTIDQQRELNVDGVNGQFIVQYDVDRRNQSSEIQVYDGYLVHFFVPDGKLDVLSKHVIFVLDTSGSMAGQKITQLQDAMVAILDDLSPSDFFSILEFDNEVKPWLSAADQESQMAGNGSELTEPQKDVPIYPASDALVVEEAIEYAVGLQADGSTNINDALSEAVRVATGTARGSPAVFADTTPMIMFLTDGQPTVGEEDPDAIKQNVRSSNVAGVPIYGLAFGDGADFDLVKELSAESRGLARKIFEGSDATIQLENFYAEISSPLLTNVTFEYVGEDLATAESVRPGSTFNAGSEFISVIKLSDKEALASVSVRGLQFSEDIFPCDEFFTLRQPEDYLLCIPDPSPRQPANFIERLWAFLTIEKLLDDKADNGNLTLEERNEKATETALRYNFVTSLTSLVVTKPSENSTSPNESFANLTPISEVRADFGDPCRTCSFHSLRGGFYQYDSPFGLDSFDYYDEELQTEGPDEEMEECLPADCRIELFSKTLFRGDNLVVANDTSNLAGFDNKVQSLRVSGSCRWTVHTELDYLGKKQSFESGEYPNAASIKTVLRKASSVKNDGC